MNRVRQAFGPSIRRAFHLYWRWARGVTLGVRGLVEEGNIEILEPPVLHGLFFNSRVSQRDHVALFIVRSFRQQRVPVPNREIAAHGFYSFDALPENTTPGTRARIAEVMLGAPLSERSNQDYRSQSRFPGPMVSADSAPHLSPTITIALPWTASSFAAVKGIIHAPGAFAPHLPVVPAIVDGAASADLTVTSLAIG